MSAANEVRAASENFYAALNLMANGTSGAMDTVWSQDSTVTALHPIGGRHAGWEQIRGSFEGVAAIASAGEIKLRDQIIQVAGDMAYEVGVENGTLTLGGLKANIDQRVTNIYRRGAGGWKLVHHHTDLSPAMLDVLARMAPPAA